MRLAFLVFETKISTALALCAILVNQALSLLHSENTRRECRSKWARLCVESRTSFIFIHVYISKGKAHDSSYISFNYCLNKSG